jgi:PAS domain S-box-containing protein
LESGSVFFCRERIGSNAAPFEEQVMRNEDMSRDQLINELRKLSLRIAVSESVEDNLTTEDERMVSVKTPDGIRETGIADSIHRTYYEHLWKELGEIRKRYRLILDSIPANISYVDTDQCIRFVNKWHEQWFGYHPKEIIGKNIRELFGEFHYQRVEAHIHAALEGSEVTFEATFSKEPDLRHIAVTLVPHKDDKEKVLGFYIMAYDITERKKAEEALIRSEREKDLILTSVSELVTYLDKDLRVVWANKAAGDSVGLPADVLTGRFCYDLWHRRTGPCSGCPVFDALKSGEQREGEITSPDGRVWFVRDYPVKGENEKITGVVEVTREVTARKRAEESLKKSEMQLAEAQQIAHLGSWEYDLQTNRFSWSEELYRICDLKPAKFRLSFRKVMKLIHPDDFNLFKKAIEAAFGNRNAFSLYHRIIRPNGTIRILHSQGKIVADDAGKLVRIIGTAQDVTARKRAEEVLKSKHRSLKEFNAILEGRVREEVAKNRQKDFLLIRQSRQAAMGEMIGNIAHQWRQPLTTIALLIQDLSENYSYGEFTQEYLESTIDHAMQVIQFMSNTIDDFRGFFKPDKQKESFLIGETIRKTISFTGASLKDKNINVDVETDDSIYISGYPNEYSQVLFSIINNAKDALLENGVENSLISIKAWDEQGRSVVTIADNAGGIPEDVMDKIFEPYFTTKEQGKGTGVGLYMAKTIIEKHMSGKLSARNIGDGAEFRIEV